MPDPVSTKPTEPAATPRPLRSRDHPIEMKVRIEFVRMAYRELNGTTLVALITAAAYAVTLSVLGVSAGVWIWLGFVAAVAGAQFGLSAAFQRANPGPAF